MTRFDAMPLGAIKPRGWLKQQLIDDLDHGFASQLDHLTKHASNDLFKDRIGTSQSQFAWWDSETRGNWLWGYTLMSYLAEHETHIARVEGLLNDLLATQEDDGYIGIYSPEWRYQHPAGENGELWAQGRALLSLLTYYSFTGKTEILEAIERAAQLTMQHYGEHNSYYQRGDDVFNNLTGLTHGLNYVDVMIWLYRVTGDEAYRDFGVWLFDDFCKMAIPFPNDDLSIESLKQEYRGLSGHSAHTGEHLRVLLWSAAMTGRDDLNEAVGQAIHKIKYNLVPSGALIGDESIHGMPMPNIGYEYCTMTELTLSLITGQELFGDVWYGDAIETLAYNAAQGARMADGKGVTYLSMDTRTHATANRPDSYSYFYNLAGRFKFSPTHEDLAVCCNPNAVRFLPHLITGMWMKANDGLVAAIYGANVLETDINSVNVTITSETFYPFTDDITFTIELSEATEFTLYLRQPSWSEKLNITADGAEISEENGYVIVRKVWQSGDAVQVNFVNRVTARAYPTQEIYSIHYGALQFVMPIEHDLEVIKDYPVEGFHDYDVRPQDLVQAYAYPILSDAQPDYGFQVHHPEGSDPLRPWHTTPIQLKANDLTLVPMGCTLLRRADFSIQMTQAKS